MNSSFLLPKSNPDLPDSYEIKVHYLTGKVEVHQVASHAIIKDWNLLELVTKDDLWSWIPINAVARFEFDKAWSKTREIKVEEIKKQEAAQGVH